MVVTIPYLAVGGNTTTTSPFGADDCKADTPYIVPTSTGVSVDLPTATATLTPIATATPSPTPAPDEYFYWPLDLTSSLNATHCSTSPTHTWNVGQFDGPIVGIVSTYNHTSGTPYIIGFARDNIVWASGVGASDGEMTCIYHNDIHDAYDDSLGCSQFFPSAPTLTADLGPGIAYTQSDRILRWSLSTTCGSTFGASVTVHGLITRGIHPPAPEPTPTATGVDCTWMPTVTPEPMGTATPTADPSGSPTPTVQPLCTPIAEESETPVATAEFFTPTVEPTGTPTITPTHTPTATAIATDTQAPTATQPATSTQPPTNTPAPAASTNTPPPTYTPYPSYTPPPTYTPYPSYTPPPATVPYRTPMPGDDTSDGTGGSGDGRGGGWNGGEGIGAARDALGGFAENGQKWGQLGVNTATGFTSAWNSAQPTSPPGFFDCVQRPLESNVCAVYYIMEHTIFAGAGTVIVPMLAILIDILIFITAFTYIKEWLGWAEDILE
jgi:hypothetical protein